MVDVLLSERLSTFIILFNDIKHFYGQAFEGAMTLSRVTLGRPTLIKKSNSLQNDILHYYTQHNSIQGNGIQ
jgi:hypothetical protein